MAGVAEESVKVAGGVVDAMRNQPLAIANIVLNICFPRVPVLLRLAHFHARRSHRQGVVCCAGQIFTNSGQSSSKTPTT